MEERMGWYPRGEMREAKGWHLWGNTEHPERGCWIRLSEDGEDPELEMGGLNDITKDYAVTVLHLDEDSIRSLIGGLVRYLPKNDSNQKTES